MRKVLKNPIFTFIIGLVLAGTIGVVASNISASNVSYGNTTLDRAMDDLYTRASTYKNLSTTTDVTANKLLNGIKAYNSDGTLVTGSMKIFTPADSYTPTSESQTISTGGKYLNGNIKINAIPSSYKDLSTATNFIANDLLAGKKAYNSDGTLVEGTALITGEGSYWKTGTINITTDNFYTVNIGFKPSKVVLMVPVTQSGNFFGVIIYEKTASATDVVECWSDHLINYGDTAPKGTNSSCVYVNSNLVITTTGFKFRGTGGPTSYGTYYYYAIK